MANTTYSVVVDLSTKGSLDAKLGETVNKLGQAHSSTTKLSNAIAGLGTSLSGAFTGAVEKAGELVMSFGKIGALAAGGALAYGVVHINNELEQTKISLSTIFARNGVVSDFNAGLSVAADTMKKLREDSAHLPVEARDVMRTFQMIANPAFSAGASIDQVREMAGQTSILAKTFMMPQEQAARELSMLLQGRAGAHNILGLQLAQLGGKKAEEFNKLSGEKRFEFVQHQLGNPAIKAAMEAQSSSFEGVFTTVKTRSSMALASATKPLFESVKTQLIGISDWFGNNQAKIEEFTTRMGLGIANAFERGVEIMKHWFPIIETFAVHAYEKIASIWERIEPIVERIGTKIGSFLQSPGAMGKIGSVLEGYTAFKIGGGVAEAAGFGGIGELGAGLAALQPELLIAVAAGLLAIGGIFDNLNDDLAYFHDSSVAAVGNIKDDFGATWEDLKDIYYKAKPALVDLADLLGATLLQAVSYLADALRGVVSVIDDVSRGLNYAAIALGIKGLNTTEAPTIDRGFDAPVLRAIDSLSTASGNRSLRAKGAGGGGGGTNIQKVGIVVTSNQDPNRIARLVHSELPNIARHPKVSGDVIKVSANR